MAVRPTSSPAAFASTPLPPAGRTMRASPRGGVTAGAVLTLVVGAILFVGGLVIVATVVLAILALALCVAFVVGIAHAFSGLGRPRQSPGPGAVIDATATVSRASGAKPGI